LHIFGQTCLFLAIGGRGGPKWLVQVEQMVVHIGTHAGGLL
jgi:hypothetical protein